MKYLACDIYSYELEVFDTYEDAVHWVENLVEEYGTDEEIDSDRYFIAKIISKSKIIGESVKMLSEKIDSQ